MSAVYPELATASRRISQIAYAEEEAFRRTLAPGTTILDTAVARGQVQPAPRARRREAFQLHDTYGFPIDLTLEMAAEQGVAVDEAGFRRLMKEQRDRAKADAQAKKPAHARPVGLPPARRRAGREVQFTGYDEVVSESPRPRPPPSTARSSRAAGAGDEVEVVLDRTPFYAEAGGQLADHRPSSCSTAAPHRGRDVQ